MPKGDHNRKLSDEQRDEIIRRYTTPLADGTWCGVTTLAREHGVRHYVIQSLLKKRGVTMRNAKEAHANGKRCGSPRKPPPQNPPTCKCGCGAPVVWLNSHGRWARYAPGHYTQRREQNPAWDGGGSFLPYAENWPMIARGVRRRDGYRCQDCGRSFRSKSRLLHVHHIDRDKTNNVDRNLVSLCASCHAWLHATI